MKQEVHPLVILSLMASPNLRSLQLCSLCDLAKIFLTSKFCELFFCNHNHKTKIGTANTLETTKNKPHGPISMIDESEIGSSSQSGHIYYTNLWQVLGFAAPSNSLIKLYTNAGPKPCCWAQVACFDFSSSNFNLPGHILSTSGGCSYSI